MMARCLRCKHIITNPVNPFGLPIENEEELECLVCSNCYVPGNTSKGLQPSYSNYEPFEPVMLLLEKIQHE